MAVSTLSPLQRSRFRPGERLESALWSCLGLVAIVVAWAVGGATTRFIAPIDDVFAGFPDFLREQVVWQAVGETWFRVLVSLALGLLVGSAAALVMWRSPFWGRVVSCYVAALLALPSTITALLGVYLFRDVHVGAVAVLVATISPFVALVMLSALERLDHGLLEMGRTYRLTWRQRLAHVLVPQVRSAFLTAVRNEHAHAWKVVVVVELYLVSSGMGFQFDRSFSKFDLVEVMQWLTVLAVILLATEYLVLRPLERSASKWKERA